MKKLLITAFISITALLFFSCEVTDVSIGERIQMFEDDLNQTDRTGIWNNFDVGGETNDTINNLSYWSQGVFANTDFTIDVQQVVGTTATALVGHSGTLGVTTIPWTFTMVAKVSGLTTTWYIAKIFDNTPTVNTYIIDNAGFAP